MQLQIELHMKLQKNLRQEHCMGLHIELQSANGAPDDASCMYLLKMCKTTAENQGLITRRLSTMPGVTVIPVDYVEEAKVALGGSGIKNIIFRPGSLGVHVLPCNAWFNRKVLTAHLTQVYISNWRRYAGPPHPMILSGLN